MKIDLSTVAEVLKHQKLDPATLRRIIEELNLKVEEGKEEGEKAPKTKTQHVIILSDPDGKIPASADFCGWVVKLEEDASPAVALERVRQVGYAYNATKKGRLYPAKTVGEIIESVPRKLWKTDDGHVQLPLTKTPVLILRTDNSLPAQ